MQYGSTTPSSHQPSSQAFSGRDNLQEMLTSAHRYHEANDLEQAATLYRRILEAVPEHPETLYNLALVHHAEGELEAAVALYRQVSVLKPGFAEAHYNLGNALKTMDRNQEAIASYQLALVADPGHANTHHNLGIAYYSENQIPEAVASFQRALDLEPEFAAAYSNLGLLYQTLGQIDQAISCYSMALKLEHNVVANRHILAALTGEKTAAPPREYVRGLFDQYAERFDHSLLTQLEYQAPAMLRQLLDSSRPVPAGFEHALDLGCGTGLSGLPFRERARRLSGVDLSASMLEQAREKGLYDALHQEEMVQFLQRTAETFDLYIAADSAIYLGDLEPFFQAAAWRIRPEGLFLLSTERSGSGEYNLRSSGRYAHATEYVELQARRHGFMVVNREVVGLRKEKGTWIKGDLFLLRFAGGDG